MVKNRGILDLVSNSGDQAGVAQGLGDGGCWCILMGNRDGGAAPTGGCPALALWWLALTLWEVRLGPMAVDSELGL